MTSETTGGQAANPVSGGTDIKVEAGAPQNDESEDEMEEATGETGTGQKAQRDDVLVSGASSSTRNKRRRR